MQPTHMHVCSPCTPPHLYTEHASKADIKARKQQRTTKTADLIIIPIPRQMQGRAGRQLPSMHVCIGVKCIHATDLLIFLHRLVTHWPASSSPHPMQLLEGNLRAPPPPPPTRWRLEGTCCAVKPCG